MENTIKSGTVVKTSKHPYQMTVKSVTDMAAICNWFDKDENGQWNDPHEEEFLLEDLEYVR